MTYCRGGGGARVGGGVGGGRACGWRVAAALSWLRRLLLRVLLVTLLVGAHFSRHLFTTLSSGDQAVKKDVVKPEEGVRRGKRRVRAWLPASPLVGVATSRTFTTFRWSYSSHND